MTAEPDLLHCAECGMPCEPGEYHPFAACLMFKASRNSTVVRANLRSVQSHATAAKDAEIEALRSRLEDAVRDGLNEECRAERLAEEVEALRAEVEMLRDAFSDEDMTAGAHWFGRYVEQKRRAEQLAEEVEALRSEVERANGWNERVSVCRDHVADIVDGPCVICALDAAEARADKLAEALRDAADDIDAGVPPEDAAAHLRARADLLREQEEGHEQ